MHAHGRVVGVDDGHRRKRQFDATVGGPARPWLLAQASPSMATVSASLGDQSIVYKARSFAWLNLAVLVAAAGCGADLKVSEDGGAGSAGAGSGGNAAYDVQGECAVICEQPCIGSSASCNEDCVAAGAFFLGCEQSAVESYACIVDSCGAQGCEDLEADIFSCLERGGCEDPEDESLQPLCENSSGSVCGEDGCDEVDFCGCTAGCSDGHSASVTYDIDREKSDISGPLFDCRCFFDGQLVGECSINGQSACLVEESCCQGLFAVD